MPLEIVHSLNENTWRNFVAGQSQGNIFHTPEMFQVFAQARGHLPVLQATVNENGEILALLAPVHVTLLDGILHSLTTRAIVYGSVLCSSTAQAKQALMILLDNYIQTSKRQALFTEMRNLNDLSYLQTIFDKNGFIYTEHLNYLIDLSGTPEKVLQNIGARTRKHIRQGLRKGNVKIERISERKFLPKWYELVRKTYYAARVPLADYSLFEAAYEILQPKGMVQFWIGHIDSECVAASSELVYKDNIYGWYGGVDRAFAPDYPGEMLMWHVLSWGAENGYKTYDFGGAGRPGEVYGVRDFKAKFGGQLVSYGRNTFVHSPVLLRFSEMGYQLYRRLIGRFTSQVGTKA